MKKLLIILIFGISVNVNAQLKVEKITNNVYALVGELSQRSPSNLGNNSTHGVIVTKDGVILIDSGASYLGAKEIYKTIKTLTNKPTTDLAEAKKRYL